MAIGLLLLYAQAVLGISVDSCACGGERMALTLFRVTAACSLCGADRGEMDCCTTETSFRKADQHKLPITTQLPAPAVSPCKMDRAQFHLLQESADAVTGTQLSRYGPKRSSPPRVILSLVQSFRI